MAEEIKLTGSICGFGFDVIVSELEDKKLSVTGRVGSHPVDLVAEVAEERITLSGRLLNKDCIVNGSKSEA